MSDTPDSFPHSAQQAVDAAITSRRSVRAFLPKPVDEATIREILEVAARAPSGTNSQPWRVRVVTGATLERLCQRVTSSYDDPAQRAFCTEEYAYYPRQWTSPYIERRRKVGWDLYGLLGIARTDSAGMHAQAGRNFRFFDAPVGLVFTIERILERGSLVDYGMFLENIMIAARGRGLDTCPQAAFNAYHRVIGEVLGFADQEMMVCAMALGFADPDAVVNRLATMRAPVAEFTTFHP